MSGISTPQFLVTPHLLKIYWGEFCPEKLTLGKILSEISGQYFEQGFKPRDRIFPAVFKESSISSSHR